MRSLSKPLHEPGAGVPLTWVGILVFWTLLSIAISIPTLVIDGWSAGTYWWPNHLSGNLISGFLSALLTPPIFHLSRRLPLAGSRWFLHMWLHLAASAVFGVVVLVLYAWVTQSFWRHPLIPIEDQVSYLGRFHLTPRMAYYWVLVLVQHMFAYSERLHREALAASRMRERLSDARLEALRARLHPHFLFNALHTVGSLTRLGDHQAATDTLESLSELLRRAIGKHEREFVPLSVELDFVEKYLQIERQRFPDRLRVSYEVTEEARAADVPSLLLQPLVENAIQHGIGGASDAGELLIRARRLGDQLQVEIIDDGPGLAADWSHEEGQGIGLGNTRARLVELFGDAFRFELSNRAPHGVVTTVEIPFRRASQG